MTLGYCWINDRKVMFWASKEDAEDNPEAAMQQEIRHVEDGMRWLQTQDNGQLVEFRIVATKTGVHPFVVLHIDGCAGSGCGGDCDAEGDMGEQVRFCWALADHDDDAIWAALRRINA